MERGWKVWLALGIVYIVWGSTYFAIKVSVETLPPLLSSGMRFTVAGLLLTAILAVRRTPLRVPWREARAAAGIGILLLACGVGVVTVAETRVDSSVAAIIAGSVPLQVILWRTLAREHVATATKLSAVVGLAGLVLIIAPTGISGGDVAIGLAMMLAASIAWSTGSFISRRVPLPKDPLVATVYEMFGGGCVLVVIALALGDGREISVNEVSTASFAAWLYLVVFGSLIAFTAYAWLLHNAPISKVVTHQYVNPLVAIVLGGLFLGESLDPATAVGAVIVIGAVFVTIRSESRSTTEPVALKAGAAAPATGEK
ncbi:MAG: EamA family transporter [Thermoleophilia bacterium]|nr:EamA family transporter [Thermoleophilia bacterium]